MLHMKNLFQIKLLGILFEYFQQRTSFSKLARNRDFILIYLEQTKTKPTKFQLDLSSETQLWNCIAVG